MVEKEGGLQESGDVTQVQALGHQSVMPPLVEAGVGKAMHA